MQRRFLGFSLATAAAGVRYRTGVTVAVLGLLVAAAPLVAHHAIQAEFDYDTLDTVTGVLQRVEWINPHAVFILDVPDENGTVTTWTISTLGPGGLRRSGLSRRGFFNPGETYTITMYKALDGSDFAWLRAITFPDGRELTIWFGLEESGV
jgi:hypothetical protein